MGHTMIVIDDPPIESRGKEEQHLIDPKDLPEGNGEDQDDDDTDTEDDEEESTE